MGDRREDDTQSSHHDAPLNVDELLAPVRQRSLRRFPKLVAGALSLCRQAAPRQLTIFAVVQIVAAVGVAAQLLVGRKLLVEILRVGQGSEAATVFPILGVFAAISIILAFGNVVRTEQQRLLGELVGRHATDQVLAVSTNVDLLAFDSPSFLNRLQRAMVNAGARPLQMATGFMGVISAGLAIVGISLAMFVIEPIFLGLVVFAYIPLWLVTVKTSRTVYAFDLEQTERDRERQYLAFVLSRKEEAAEIRAFGLAHLFRTRYERLWTQRLADLVVVARRRLRLGLIAGTVTSLLTALTVAVLVVFLANGRLDEGSAGAAAGAIVLLGQRLQALAGSSGALYESSLFIEDFTTFVSVMPQLEKRRQTGVPPKDFAQISARDLRFSYPGQPVEALQGVSIEVARGEVVALVGENGSGKTTLAKLLAGLYQPVSGSIRWDGTDLATCDPALIQESVAIIFQDFVHYMLTAHENISVGRPQMFDDRDGVRAAAQRAGADEFLSALANGYHTRLGAQFFGGRDLSVGQWQRVALARAFFRDASFLILDEPSSSLDPRAEARLFESVRELYVDRAVLLISHRFSTVKSADRIYVLSDGRVLEHGAHKDLMKNKGLYAELFTLQASSFVDGVQ